MMRRAMSAWLLALLAVSACGRGDATPDATASGASSAADTVADSAGTITAGAWTMYPDGARSSWLRLPAATSAGAASAGAASAGAASAGPQLRIGMSGAETRAALGLPASAPSTTPEPCVYLDASSLPVRLYFMLVSDTLVRIDVRDSTVATAEGARVGHTEARIAQLYPGRVTTQPHKYTGPTGHYLVVPSTSDAAHLTVFETDGQRVTNYRVGRKPEVEWVEGCS